MKKLSFFLMAMLVSLTSFAAALGEGYEKVTNISTLAAGDKVVLYCDDSSIGVTGVNGSKDAAVAATGWVEYLVEAATGGVKLKDTSANKYVSLTTKNTFTYAASGSVCKVNAKGVLGITLSGSDYFLYSNNGQYYRMYTDKTGNSSYKPFYVYKVVPVEVDPDATMYTVTVKSADETMGTVTGSGEYAEGSTATLEASPKAGYEFVKWSNESTDNPLKLTVTEDIELTATFQAQTPITIAEASQLKDAATCILKEFTVAYVYKSYIHIQDASGYGMIYAGSFGLKAGDVVTGFTCSKSTYNGLPQFTPTCKLADLTVVAGEAPAVAELTTAPTGNYHQVVKLMNLKLTGSFNTSSGTTLTATCPDGKTIAIYNGKNHTYTFVADKTYNITGDVCQYSGKIQVSAYAIEEYVAPVVNHTITVSANPAEAGTVTGGGEFEEGTEATLTATANEGYEFTCWTSGEDTVSTANPYTFAVTANVALVANFKEVVVEEPVEAKLYLTPNANWKQGNARFAAYFFGNGETWVGMTKVDGETDLYEVTIPTDKKYPNVIFCRMNPGAAANNWNNKWNQTSDLVIPTDGKNHYTVKAGTWDKGGGTWSIWPVPTVKTYVDITITVTANAPASIKWANAGDKLANATEYVAMTAGENNTYTYTLAQVDEAKGVDYTIKVGDIVSTTQNTSKNVTVDFKNLLPQVAIEGIDGKWDSSNKMTVSDDYLTASITLPLAAKDHAWKLTIDAAWLGGSKFVITRTNNSVVVKEDANGDGKLTADIAGDYVFTWTYATKTLTVTYPELPVEYTVTATVNPAETGTVAGAGKYEEGKEATLTATPAEGYQFVNWTVGDSIVSTENPYKFTVTADLALVANFKEAVTTITETFDLTQEDDTRNMGAYVIFAGDYTLRIYGYTGAGTYQDDPATEEDAAPLLFTPDYEEALNAVVVVTIDEENNKEVMQVTATSADGKKVYNLTINIALPSYETFALFATGIQAENGEMEGTPIIRLKGEGYLGEETVPFNFMVYETMEGYAAEGSIGDIYAYSTEAMFFVEEGSFTFMATMQDEEMKYLFKVEMYGTMAQPEVEIVVKETKDVTLYNLNMNVQGNMAMVTAEGETLSFWLTLLETENYYGTYTNDAFSNIWYGDDQLYAAYGEAQVYAEVDGKAKFVVSFISTPDAEGNVTLYNFTLYAGEKTATGVENLDATIVPVKMIENGQLIIMKGDTKYNVQGAKL